MLSRTIVPAFKGALSLHQSLELCNAYLDCAFNTTDRDIALLLCHDAEGALSHAKSAEKRLPNHLKDNTYQTWRRGIATAYIDLGKLLELQGFGNEASLMCKKTEKWGGNIQDPGRLAQSSPRFIMPSSKDAVDSVGNLQAIGSAGVSSVGQQKAATVASNIFPEDIQPPSVNIKLPESDQRLIDTPQLACCLSLLQAIRLPVGTLEPRAHQWLQVTEKDTDEQERLHAMATDVIRAFKRDELKDAKVIAEVVYLAPVLAKDPFKDMLRDFYTAIDQSGLLNTHRVEGIAQLIQGADSGYLDADDLVKILKLLSTRLRDTHHQSSHHRRQLTLAVSHVLDAMAETQVKDVDREKIHEPLMEYLNGLMKSSDPFLVYQAAYAYQALLCVPDDETLWQATLRRTGRVVKGLSGLVSAVKSVDLIKFMDGLDDIQKGLGGVSKVIEVASAAYKDVSALAQSGQGFLESLKEGLCFKRKSAWYPALRGADTLIRRGELGTFRTLVCEAPCRYNEVFQWGVCQRLGEIAANPMWDSVTRRSAIDFLGEIYRNDDMWGQHASVKQWILNILMQLTSTTSGSSESGSTTQLHAIVAGTLLQELEVCDNVKKQELYRECRANGPIDYPLKISLPELASPSLLDRVQNRPDVEGYIRMLKKQRTRERGNAVYVPPQAKESLHDADTMSFPLMEKVNEFLGSERKVFLLLGDSGAGKSTFSRELEFQLWQSYTNKIGRIPLHINLPTIEKPEYDMIAKQLRKHEFTEPQIREMKHYRKFILICDGYDESQQTHNLYMSNKLNEPGEWNAHMVISCRSEYLGSDYRDRFQPGDRNKQLDSVLFQEVVIAPFSLDQVNSYIEQYVLTQQPLWRVEDYKQALDLIPSLTELVKNPFLMALSLDVLPRMVDPGQHLSSTRVTRVGLYDHFVEQWLERNKKRLGEKDLNPQSKEAFEGLSTEGFSLNGIEYLKKLAVAIYKEQDGHPIVKYARLVDEGSWKDAFFREKYKKLLLEACPVTRNGNQLRFIHRSILEYALTRAVFDPQDIRNTATSDPYMGGRSSADSSHKDESHDDTDDECATTKRGPDSSSPLVWRSFVNDYSLLHFLEERVRQEPVFKKQLLDYIEHSKTDKKWRKAAANSITILVRAGFQFIGADLQGIQIPGADLSYGTFDSAQLQGANMKNVSLRGISLRQADLSGALMTRARFGELPYLQEDNELQSCVYSPDGRSFMLCLVGGEIKVYSTSTWESILTLSGHTNDVRRAVYSPGGKQIASASRDHTIQLWDAEAGTCQHILTDHNDEVNCVAYSPQGDRLASAGDDKTVRLWDSETGRCLQILYGHTDIVESVEFSPIGDQIASGGKDRAIRLWDVEEGSCTHILFGHTDKIWDIAYSPRGDQFASASYDNTARLWDARTGTCRHILTGHGGRVASVAYSPKGDQVATGSGDTTVRLWDTETGAHQHTFNGHNNGVMSVAYSPRGDQIASGSFDMTVRLWDVSAAASRIVSGGHTHDVYDISCSPQGHLIASASRDNTIRLWDAESGSCRQTLRGHTNTVQSIAFSPKGDMLVSGGFDNSVRLWDVESGDCLRVLNGHINWVGGVAFSPQGHLIVSSSWDKTVRLWDLSTGDCRGTLRDHTGYFICIALSPNGSLVASGGSGNTVHLWDVESLNHRHVLNGHTFWICGVTFSPDGSQVASTSRDATVRIWDVESGDCQTILIGHSECVYCVAYSPNGGLLASGSMDKTVRLWDVTSGECRAVVQDFQGSIRCLNWRSLSDGNYLVTGEEGGSVLMWKVTEDEDVCRVSPQWSASMGKLILTGTTVQGIRGLSQLNKQLLKQRGAEGEPEYQLYAASKKLIAMASVVSKLKQLSNENGLGVSLDMASS